MSDNDASRSPTSSPPYSLLDYSPILNYRHPERFLRPIIPLVPISPPRQLNPPSPYFSPSTYLSSPSDYHGSPEPDFSSWNEGEILCKRPYYSSYALNEENTTENHKRPRVDGWDPRNHKETQTTERLYVNNFMKGLQELLQSGEHSDATLNVSGKEFNVHRAILSAHSPVFKAMMTHDTKENATGIINIDDCDPDTFSHFIDFMYSGSLDVLDSENVFNLFTVADKYQVKELCDLCLMYMFENISVETVCDIMALSLRYDNKLLTFTATEYFVDNAEAVLKTPKWLMFLKDNTEVGNELILKAFKSEKH